MLVLPLAPSLLGAFLHPGCGLAGHLLSTSDAHFGFNSTFGRILSVSLPPLCHSSAAVKKKNTGVPDQCTVDKMGAPDSLKGREWIYPGQLERRESQGEAGVDRIC